MSYGVFELQGGLFAWFAHKVLTNYTIVWKLDIELKLQCCEQNFETIGQLQRMLETNEISWHLNLR